MAALPLVTPQPISLVAPHHPARTFFAAIFGLAAILCAVASVLVVWLDQTLTNQSLFVSTLTPLSRQADIQNFVASKAADTVLENVPLNDLAIALLPTSSISDQTQTQTQLQTSLRPVLYSNFIKIVSSTRFDSLWQDTIVSAHEQLMSQLHTRSSVVTINLQPAVQGAIDELQSTDLRIVSDKVRVQGDVGVIILKGSILNRIRDYDHLLQTTTLLILAVTAVSILLCAILSVHHMRTVRRILISFGIIVLVLSLTLGAPAVIESSADTVQQKAAVALATTLFHNLQTGSAITGIVCIVVAIASKLFKRPAAHV